MNWLISRVSTAQFVCFIAILLGLVTLYALRPLPNVGNNDGAKSGRTLTAQGVQYADLTDAVTALQAAGFINSKAMPGNTMAAESLGGDGEMTGLNMAGLSPLPKVIAIVRSRGTWEAYFRQEGDLMISAAGDQIGDWSVDSVSQGEIVLSNGDTIEIIDIFGAREKPSQEQ